MEITLLSSLKQKFLISASLLILLGAGCTGTGSEQNAAKNSPVKSAELTPIQLAERGKAIYLSNCISCHNVQPSKSGTVGPAIAGSSLELLEARILRAEYPAGYKPQRETAQMPALPQLKKEIPALHAYLNSPEALNAK